MRLGTGNYHYQGGLGTSIPLSQKCSVSVCVIESGQEILTQPFTLRITLKILIGYQAIPLLRSKRKGAFLAQTQVAKILVSRRSNPRWFKRL